MTSQRRRAWGVVIATFLALILVPFAAMSLPAAQAAPGGNGNGNGNGGANGNGGNGNGNGGNPHNTTTTTCSYPSNNCPTTTTKHGPKPIIVLELTVAVPGQVVRITVCGYAPGTVIKIELDGVVVGQIVVGNEPPKTCTASNAVLTPAVIGPLGRVFAQAGNSGADGSFTVPSNEHAGSHTVCAVDSDGGTETPCATLAVANGNGLLSSNNGGSFLAFTGFGLIRLLLLAGALIVGGLLLVRRDRVHHA